MEHERDGRNGLVFFARDTTGLDSLNGIPEKHFLGHFIFVIFVVRQRTWRNEQSHLVASSILFSLYLNINISNRAAQQREAKQSRHGEEDGFFLLFLFLLYILCAFTSWVVRQAGWLAFCLLH